MATNRAVLWRQFKAVFTKVVVHRRKRRPSVMLLEVVWPVALFTMVIAIRQGSLPERQDKCYYQPRAMPSAGALAFLKSHICNVNNKCNQKELYKDASRHKQGLGGSAAGRHAEKPSFALPEGSSELLKTAPKVLHLVSKLKEIFDQPGIKPYVSEGGLQLKTFIKDQTLLQQELKRENIHLAPGLFEELIEAKLKTSSSSKDGVQKTSGLSSILDLKGTLCDPTLLATIIHIPLESKDMIGQVSAELCKADHKSFSLFVDLITRELKTDSITGKIISGVQSLVSYTSENAISDLAIVMQTLAKLQILKPVLKVIPLIGGAGNILDDIKLIIVNAQDTDGIKDVMKLAAPLVGQLLNDHDFSDTLVDIGGSVDGILRFIQKSIGGFSVQLVDIVPDRVKLQLMLQDISTNDKYMDRALHAALDPAAIRDRALKQEMGRSFFKDSCSNSLDSIDNIFKDADSAESELFKDAICDLGKEKVNKEIEPLLDFKKMTSKMDSLQRARTLGTVDFFLIIEDVTKLTSSTLTVSEKIAYWVQNFNSLSADLRERINKAFNVKFVLDHSVEYSATEILDLIYSIFSQAEEFKSIAAAIQLGKQILMSAKHDWIEFKTILRDPLVFSAALFGTDLSTEVVNKILGSEINLPGLLGLANISKDLSNTLCTGGKVLNLLGVTSNIKIDAKAIENVLCGASMNVGGEIDVKKLTEVAVFNQIPNYMLYGDFFKRTVKNFNVGVIQGVGTIIDIIKGDLKFEAAVLFKPLYFAIKDLGVSGRANLSSDTPTLFDLLKDRVKEPKYFIDDIKKLSEGIRTLSIFQRKVQLAVNLKEFTKHPEVVSSFLQKDTDLSPTVSDILLKSNFEYDIEYNIQDVVFQSRKGGERCGPSLIRNFLNVPNVTDWQLETLTDIICSLNPQKITALVKTIFPLMDIRDLVKYMLDLSPTNLLKSANLSRVETKTFVTKIGPIGAQFSTLLGEVKDLGGAENKTLTSTSEVLASYGAQLCGDSEAFTFGKYGAAFLSAKLADKEKDELEEKKEVKFVAPSEPNWTPIQLEEILEFDDPTCVGVYKSINSMPGIGPILWSFIKPLTRGKILYSPNTAATNAIMKEAYWLFESISKLIDIAQTWIDFADKMDSHGKGDSNEKGIGDFMKLVTNPLVSSAIKNTIGITGEQLGDDLLGNAKLTPAVIEKFTEFAKSFVKYANCFDYGLEGFPTEGDMRERAMNLSKTDTFFAGVVFYMKEDKNRDTNKWNGFTKTSPTKLPNHVEYILLLSENHVVITRGLFSRVKQAGPDDDFLDDLRYLWGFVLMQDLIESAFIKLKMKEHDVTADLPRISTQAFPYPCYDQDEFIVWSSFVIVIILLFSWLCMMAVGITSAVSEKETGIEDTMLVMGMNGSINRLAWFTNTLLGMIFLSAFVTALIRGGNLVPHSEPLLIFIWLSSYSVAIVMLCYLVSALVHRTTLASLFGLFVYLMLCIPFIILHSMGEVFELNFQNKVLMSLSVTSAFCFGANELIAKEKNGHGITWGSAFRPSGDTFPFAWSCIMIAVDSGIYFLLSWYISNTFPGKHGLAQPWYFPLSPYFWGYGKKESLSCDPNSYGAQSSRNQRRVPGEAEPKNLPIGISVCGLSKTYNIANRGCFSNISQSLSGKRTLKAVDDLSVNFFQGQVTAFLGHNGAGKSTCIHMLTGLILPTDGTAYINGYNIKDGFDEIRKMLGFCPQNDVLFDYMTIKEHFYFYARIKGKGSQLDTQEEVDSMLRLTGLRRFKNVTVDRLSGGQRRRVSVGNAFIGGSNVIILDEPTSGVDPAARRLIWDIIVQHKKGRTILLCTHHLDEADVLGDRIVIMHQGKLICSGSSLWLKKNYGSGYQLTISKTTEEAKNRKMLSAARRPNSEKWDTSAVLKFVRDFVPGAQIVEEVGTEVSIVLPTKRGQNVRFQELFVHLEARKDDLHIDKYGIADSTLEEVFLKLTLWTDQGKSLDPNEIRDWVGPRGNDNMDFEHDNRGIDLDRRESGTGSFQLSTEDDYSIGMPRSSSDEFSQCEGSGSASGGSDSSYRPNYCQPSSLSNSNSGSAQDVNIVDSMDGKLSSSRRFTGMALKSRQFRALLLKRLHHHRRDLKSHISQIILPSLFVCLAMLGTFFTKASGIYRPTRIDASMYGPDQEIVFSMLNATPLANAMMDTLKEYPGMGTLCMPLDPGIPRKTLWEKRTQYCRDTKDYNSAFTKPPKKSLPSRMPNCSCSTGTWTCPAQASGSPRPTLVTSTHDRVVNLTGFPLGIEEYLMRTFNVFKNTELGGIFGGWTFDRKDEHTLATVWYNNKGVHSLPAYYNALNNMALRASINMHTNESVHDYGISLHNQPMNTSKWPISQNGLLMSFSDTGVSLTILIAYCFVPASYIIYVINERIRQEKRLQFLTGVGVTLYWFSALLWDLVTYSITVGITIGITKAFGIHVYTYGENLAALATILMLFGWATIPLMYLLSRWFDNPMVGYVAAFIINLCIGINTSACVFFLQTPIFNNRPEILMARRILTNGLLVFPQFCLGHSLVMLAYNQILTDIMNLFHIDSYTSPFSTDLLFYHYLTLGIEGVLFFIIHLMLELNLCDRTRKVKRKANYREDSDVGLERQRVVTGGAEEDLLVLYNLSKVYQQSGMSTTLAVDNLCVAVPRAECFGLLGINGAGKTTSFKMITGEIHPSSGAAILNGNIISEDVSSINQNVGYCPQCDALDDYLTGEEMIYYFSRLRGIYEEDIPEICATVVRKFKLESHIKKRIVAWSAGNKRKLSTAIALIGEPDLVLLDEPTTGMDPGTRRLVWSNIMEVIKDKRSVILTSHSMEECDALCTRMAIMVNGTFKCMGSSQHLKNKFGTGYTIKLRVGGTIADVKTTIRFMLSKFPGAHLKDQHLHMLEFGLPSNSCTLAALFRRLEREKKRLKIENYSVTQTTLDNVFLHFAKKQSDNMQATGELEDGFFDTEDAMEKADGMSEDGLTSVTSDTMETSSSAPPAYRSKSSRRSIAPNGYDITQLSREGLDDVSQVHASVEATVEAFSVTSSSRDDDDIDISVIDGSGGESSTDTGNLGGVESSSSGSEQPRR